MCSWTGFAKSAHGQTCTQRTPPSQSAWTSNTPHRCFPPPVRPLPAPSRTRKFAKPLAPPPTLTYLLARPLCHAHCAPSCHTARERAALDAMGRTEFLNIFTPAELAAHREARGGAGWPLVDHMRGKVHISHPMINFPSFLPRANPSPSISPHSTPTLLPPRTHLTLSLHTPHIHHRSFSY